MNDTASINEWLRRMLFLPPQSSTVAQSIDHLHMFVIIVTMIGSASIGVLAVGYVIKHRHPAGAPLPRNDARETPGAVEIGIALGLFALFIGWWVIGFFQYVRIRVAPPNTYDIYVTAKQWMWKFSYPDGQSAITTLYVPAGRPVKLIMTSRDVIHSFFVPDFRLKQDVIPGRYSTLWFEADTPGKHQILCAEYCGTNHSTMRGEVIALDEADFARWLARGADRTSTVAPRYEEPSIATELGPAQPMSLERLGEAVAAQEGCLRCHTLDGAPHIGPTWAGLYRASVPLADGTRAVADEAYLTESMMDPLAHIRAGYKPVMPSYLGRLRPAETAAILALIKSLEHVRGQEPMQAAPALPVAVPPAGAIGQPKPPSPMVAPSSQGLPPPGAVVMPAPAGEVTVGPNGPVGVTPSPPPGQPLPRGEEEP